MSMLSLCVYYDLYGLAAKKFPGGITWLQDSVQCRPRHLRNLDHRRMPRCPHLDGSSPEGQSH